MRSPFRCSYHLSKNKNANYQFSAEGAAVMTSLLQLKNEKIWLNYKKATDPKYHCMQEIFFTTGRRIKRFLHYLSMRIHADCHTESVPIVAWCYCSQRMSGILVQFHDHCTNMKFHYTTSWKVAKLNWYRRTRL